MMGRAGADAGPRPGVLAVRDLDAAALSRHRPHQGAAARHQRARRVRRAADLSRLGLRQRLQPVRPHLPRDRAGRRAPIGSTPRTCSRSACAIPAARPCRSAPSPPCATSPAPIACRATISIRRPSSTAPPRPAIRRGRRSRSCRSSPPRRCRDGFSYEWTTLAFQQLRAGNTAMFAFVLGGGVRVPGAGGAVRKPDAAARGHPDRADVPGRLDHRRAPARAGQQHPHPGRLHRADRACRQERDPDRRVRQAARGSGPRPLGPRRSRRRACGCGRS